MRRASRAVSADVVVDSIQTATTTSIPAGKEEGRAAVSGRGAFSRLQEKERGGLPYLAGEPFHLPLSHTRQSSHVSSPLEIGLYFP